MSDAPMPSIDEIENLVTRLRLGIGASELDGSITGLLCAGGTRSAAGWLATLELEGIDAAPGELVGQRLDALAAVTGTGLNEDPPRLQLLLPDDHRDGGLEARALGLVDWCRGFLGGFGLGGVSATSLDPGMTGILHDFSDIATTVPELGEYDDDEAALNELIEHVRFGALLLHAHLTVPRGSTRQ